jgi:tRNA A-37 threonylcarbamoyl transferase component Bud32
MGNKNGKDSDLSSSDSVGSAGAPTGGSADQSKSSPPRGPPPAASAGAAQSGQFMSVIDDDGSQYSVRSDAPLSKITANEEETDTFNTNTYKRAAPLSVDDFDLLKVIGKGSFGKVMQVRKKDSGKIYAMKVLKKDQLIARKQVAHTKTERKVLEDIDSPFISQLKFAFQTANKLYIVMDYYNGGELFFHLKEAHRFDEERAKFYAAQIVIALETLHHHGIVYRDLKPENILLEASGFIRLSDFGLAKEGITKENLTTTFCGT